MDYDIRVEEVKESQPLAVVRRRAGFAELSKVVPEACGVVWKAISARGLKPQAGRHVAVYWDDEINLEVGVEFNGAFPGGGDVVGSSLPAGRVATAVHFGPYTELHHAHVAIRDWCRRQGHELAGPNWELYGHWTDECNRDPSKIRTDVYYLLTR